MIEWILHRPPHASNSAEIRTAELLRSLEASPYLWTVVWGYYYRDKAGMDREGDFLILGPAGGLLVLEVKSSLPRHFAATGRWEGEDGSDPIQQLIGEWQGVIKAIEAKGRLPYVAKALCVPGADESPDVEFVQGVQRSWLVTGNDFGDWTRTWIRLFGDKVRRSVEQDQKRAFLQAFGQGSLPEEKQSFIDHTEKLFERQFTSRFTLLDQLSENRQLLVRGGTGTGKTWHALEQAFRYARSGDGQKILFLTYNKALTAQLRRIIALRQLDRGEVVVRGWEELFLELPKLAGAKMEPPSDVSNREANRVFYEIDLPRKVLELSRDPAVRSLWPAYDALVVDEGQDHDTSWHGEISAHATESGGWWHIYQLLLRNGRESSAGIFYDAAQRPPFRAADRFDPAVLAAAWSQPAHVRLQPALRYTRPIWQFFHYHSSPVTAGMIEALGSGDQLPEGPDPEIHPLAASTDASDLVESILLAWKNSGLCDPSDVLILHAQSEIAKSPIGDRRVLAGRNLRECTELEDAPGTIRHTSVHKAKGLDSKAVILIGMPPHKDLTSVYEQYTWFMAASRARQLLAVVEN
jgi:hypothetical protein